MSTAITLDSGIKRFKFTDEDGDVFASFRLNPAAPSLTKRAEEVAAYLEEMAERELDLSSAAEFASFNDKLEEKMCYLLGYDAHDELFGVVEAATILPDGNLFAMAVLDIIAEAIQPELEKRAEKVHSEIEKYAAKYSE